MAIALTIKIQDYILEDDRKLPKEEQTTWKLKPLTAKESMIATNEIGIKRNGEVSSPGTYLHQMLVLGLVGWENFLDSGGEQVKFGKDQEKNIDYIPAEYRAELSNAIIELSSVKDRPKEVKN